jgi:UTP-glucose-1-phosphate uridylyltransferase
MLEKPSPAETRSRQAVAARMVIGPGLLGRLREQAASYSPNTTKPEWTLTMVLQQEMAERVPLRAVPLLAEEARLDAGSPEEYWAMDNP